MQNRRLRHLWPVSLVFISPVVPGSSMTPLFFIAHYTYNVPIKNILILDGTRGFMTFIVDV